MDCYTVRIYVSAESEGSRDAVVELESPNTSSISCYHIATDGEVVMVPDIRLTIAVQEASLHVLESMLEIDRSSLDWRSISRGIEHHNRAA